MRYVLAFSLLLAACAPKFEPKGSLAIDDGTTFAPVSCTVVPGTGLELEDAQHDKLRLAVPNVVIGAFEEKKVTSDVRYEAAGKPPRMGPACGALTLKGEGYHGAGKRAVSGSFGASCIGTGEVSFTGCF